MARRNRWVRCKAIAPTSSEKAKGQSPRQSGGEEDSGEMFDLILRGGEVVDGTGAPRFAADVAILGERIEAVGPRIAGPAREELPIPGLVIAPGFIDLH